MPILDNPISNKKKCECGNPAVVRWKNPLTGKSRLVCDDCLTKLTILEESIFSGNTEEDE